MTITDHIGFFGRVLCYTHIITDTHMYLNMLCLALNVSVIHGFFVLCAGIPTPCIRVNTV